MNSIEFCAGAGGQALGLEQAVFRHSALVEIEPDYAATLRLNRPNWDVRCADMNSFDGRPFEGIDMFAGGLPAVGHFRWPVGNWVNATSATCSPPRSA